MPVDYKTPGVYIEELNAFPPTAVAVETAVPVFIGYTETAEFKNNSLLGKPVKITSLFEYQQRFGGASKLKFTVAKAPATTPPPANPPAPAPVSASIKINTDAWNISCDKTKMRYLYNSIRLFYQNGGSTCYILSVNTYDKVTDVAAKDFTDDAIYAALKKEQEPTLVVIPDAIALGAGAYAIYTKVLTHCKAMQTCFGIFDLEQQIADLPSTDDIAETFRTDIGVNYLNYGAAYFPWLSSSIVDISEIDQDNLTIADADLTAIVHGDIPAGDSQAAIQAKADKLMTDYKTDIADPKKDLVTTKTNYNQSLTAVSPTYKSILLKVLELINELPPSGAMAGIYTAVDTYRGVWKAPANVSVSMVNAPSVIISSEGQQNLNVDAMSGKSINVIRSFPGIGTLVWGARTLDGNSQDWKYVNVRRTLIFIEQSLKLATRAFVFEPNDANTWITVKSMFDNFLTNLWKQGALQGTVPAQAFSVQIGLGTTMTYDDILDGKMNIMVKVAIVRPAEFIIITFQQQMVASS